MALPDSTSNVTVRKLAATLSSYNTKLNEKFDAKADKVANAVGGDLAGLDSYGNLTDSGKEIDKVVVLDSNNKVPSQYLPSYVDDVIEGYYYNGKFYEESAHTHEITPEGGKIYVSLDTNKTYRWGGTEYVCIASDLALGETETTAYRGDRGKAAYDHSQLTSGNPHHVTASDVGLGNVDNTSDATKKTNFTGTIASGNTGFATGGAVYDALLSKGKGIEEVTLSNTYAEVDAIISAGKIPVLVDPQAGVGITRYYLYAGVYGEGHLFTTDAVTYSTPSGATEPIRNQVHFEYGVTPSYGWVPHNIYDESPENRVSSWPTDGTGAYKYPNADLVKSSLDQKAAVNHTHGNITNDGKIGSTADLAVVTATGGAVTTANLTTSSPSTGDSPTVTFIATVSQDSRGQISATKQTIRAANASHTGVVQLATSIGATVSTENGKAATEKAVRDALDANGKGVEFIDFGTGTFDDITAIITAGKLPVVRFAVQNQGTIAQYLYAPLIQSAETSPQAYVFTLTTGTQVLSFTRPKTGSWDMGTYGLALLDQVVRHDTTQSLDPTHKATARANIGAGTSDLVIGTTAGTAAEGNHTHATTIATDTGSPAIALVSGGKYKLSTGGTSTVFSMPTIPAAANDGALKIGLNGGAATSKFTANQSADSTLTFATGSANGTIAVDGTDVSVKGLGTAAYTAATNYATSDHTHTTTLATSSGTATVTVAPGLKYQLTAGGTSVIFDVPEMSDAEITALLAELN